MKTLNQKWILLYVDQLLTGFDAKRINSIYIIKNLKKHSLIQAISRTNRVFNHDKERGIVVSYVPGFKYNTDESIKMYSDSSKVDHVIKRDFKKLLSEASKAYKEVTEIDVEELLKNPSQNKKKALTYIKRVNNLANHYRVVRTVGEYDDSKIDSKFNLDELNKMIGYSKIIRNKYKKTDEWKDMVDYENNPFDSVDIPIHIDNVDTIDSEYIRVLLSHAVSSHAKGNIQATKEQIQEIRNKIKSIDGGELLFDVFDELLNKFNKNNLIDINKSLREILIIKNIIYEGIWLNKRWYS